MKGHVLLPRKPGGALEQFMREGRCVMVCRHDSNSFCDECHPGWLGVPTTDPPSRRDSKELFNLRAEVERLTCAITAVHSDNDRLRVEVERLTRERDEALAEAGNWRTLHAGTLKECDKLLAERTRERDEAVGHLQEVLGGECEIAGRWCLTHRTNDCAVAAAREFLARVKP